MTATNESSAHNADHATGLPGPSAAFPIAPDDASRRQLMTWQGEYGDLFAVPSSDGGLAHWMVNDPALAQQVLVRQANSYAKGMGLDRVKILLGNGIMVSEGDFWTRQRRLTQPAFRPRRLGNFNTMILDDNLALAERWADAAGRGESIEAESHTSELTLVIVLKSIFGADYPRLVEDGANPFALLTEQAERNLRFAARFHHLKQTVDAIIERRLAEGPHEPLDFLGHLMTARSREGDPMSRSAIIDEVMTLIVAGHETTASALAFAWYLIASHPEVCARMQPEADAVDEGVLRETGGADRETLAYTDRVVAEMLRLYPPGWLLSRRALANQALGDHLIAAPARRFSSALICCSAIRVTGASPLASTPIASRARTSHAIAWPTCRSRRARGIASASTWRPPRCACTWPCCCAASRRPGSAMANRRSNRQSISGRRTEFIYN